MSNISPRLQRQLLQSQMDAQESQQANKLSPAAMMDMVAKLYGISQEAELAPLKRAGLEAENESRALANQKAESDLAWTEPMRQQEYAFNDARVAASLADRDSSLSHSKYYDAMTANVPDRGALEKERLNKSRLEALNMYQAMTGSQLPPEKIAEFMNSNDPYGIFAKPATAPGGAKPKGEYTDPDGSTSPYSTTPPVVQEPGYMYNIADLLATPEWLFYTADNAYRSLYNAIADKTGYERKPFTNPNIANDRTRLMLGLRPSPNPYNIPDQYYIR